MTITQKMEEFYEVRTELHIRLYNYYASQIDLYREQSGEEPWRLTESRHDQSKLEEPERTPYILITWDYRCKDRGIAWNPPPDIKTLMSDATFHHVRNNPHHPEYWVKNLQRQDRENRDAPGNTPVDASAMPDKHIAEMVGDWMAMSREKGTEPKAWADRNVNIRWEFTPHQVGLIYDLIQNVWKE